MSRWPRSLNGIERSRLGLIPPMFFMVLCPEVVRSCRNR